MRVVVFFDLPSITPLEKREYSRFRRFLLKEGFIMMQESVYSKLTLNTTSAVAVRQNVIKNKPSSGIVQLMTITERQFTNIEFIIGKKNTQVLDIDERFVVL